MKPEEEVKTLLRYVRNFGAPDCSLVSKIDLWNLVCWAYEEDKISLSKASELLGVPLVKMRQIYPMEPVDVMVPE